MGKQKQKQVGQTPPAGANQEYYTAAHSRDVGNEPAIELSPRELETAMLLWPVLPADDVGEFVPINTQFLGNYFNILPGTADGIKRRLMEKGVIHRSPDGENLFCRGRNKVSLDSHSELTIDGKIIKPKRMYTMDILGAGRYEGALIEPDDVDTTPPSPPPPAPASFTAPPPVPPDTAAAPAADALPAAKPVDALPPVNPPDPSIEPVTLSRQQALLAILLWPHTKEEAARINWAWLAEKIGTSEQTVHSIMPGIIESGVFTSSKRGHYKQGKSFFRLGSRLAKEVTFDQVKMQHGQVYDLNSLTLISYDEVILKPVDKPAKPSKEPKEHKPVAPPKKAKVIAKLESLLAVSEVEYQELLLAKQKADEALAAKGAQRDDIRFALEQVRSW